MSEQRALQESGLGRYRLLGRLGEGGMGVVHLAEGADGRPVALKVLRPHVVGDDESRMRLAREVTSLRRVRSRRVAEVIDADPWGDTPYVVTRYVRGPSLYERVSAEGPLAGGDLGRVVHGLLEALADVHRAGVLHRDVKPSNVLLEDGAPVLIDFGLARLLDDPRLTGSGWLLGTPGYLAPEVLSGADPSAAADMHAWAATVAYAATGRPPYGSGPAMAVMDRIRRGEYDLSTVPVGLRDLLSECLAPDPRRRPTAEAALGWQRAGDIASAHGSTATRQQPHPGETRPLTVAAPVARVLEEPDVDGEDDDEGGQTEPAAPTLSERLARLGTGTAVLACFLAAAVLAPLAAATALVAAIWLGCAASRMFDAADARRARRGRRGSDPFVASVTSPWHLLLALPSALALGALAVGSGALAALAVVTVGNAGWQWPALGAGAAVSAALACWGPLSARSRSAGLRLLARVADPSSSALVPIAAFLGLAAALFVLSQVVGTWWWPTSGPPSTFELSVLDPRR